jgi:hypothetical protein
MEELGEQVYDLSVSQEDKSVELEALLEENPGVDVNLFRNPKNGTLALHAAAYRGHAAPTRLLIGAKADLEVKDSTQQATALWWASHVGNLECLQVLIESKANVQTPDDQGFTPAFIAANVGNYKCLQLLIDAKADVNATPDDGSTSAMSVCQEDRLTFLQLLVDAKADLNVKNHGGADAVYYAMLFPDESASRVPGMSFAVLSCNTDTKTVHIDPYVTQAVVDTHTNEYKQIQAFIDEYHTITNHALSEDVVVDTRVGRGDCGLYHEPLEQVLLYLGLSMKKDQTVNTSIDGKSGVARALIPMHPINTNLWFELYKRENKSITGGRRRRRRRRRRGTMNYAHIAGCTVAVVGIVLCVARLVFGRAATDQHKAVVLKKKST